MDLTVNPELSSFAASSLAAITQLTPPSSSETSPNAAPPPHKTRKINIDQLALNLSREKPAALSPAASDDASSHHSPSEDSQSHQTEDLNGSQQLLTQKRPPTYFNLKSSSARPFVCELCGLGFTQKGNLSRHKQIHTPIKPFKCDICPYASRRKDALINHRSTHCIDKPFKCPHCPQAYKQKSSLRDHLKAQHRLNSRQIRDVLPPDSTVLTPATYALSIAATRPPPPPPILPRPTLQSATPATAALQPSTAAATPPRHINDQRVLIIKQESGMDTGDNESRESGHLPKSPTPLPEDLSLKTINPSSEWEEVQQSRTLMIQQWLSQQQQQQQQQTPSSDQSAHQPPADEPPSPPSSYHCASCGVWFLDQVLYSIHMGVHTKGNPLQCNLCGFVADNRYDFASHVTRGRHSQSN